MTPEVLRGGCLVLAAFFLASTLGAPISVGLRPLLPRRLAPAARARLLFTLRLLPSALAAATVLLLVVPAYLAHEPWGIREAIGPVLLILAAAALLPIAAGLRRMVCAYRATRRLEAEWQQGREPVVLAGGARGAFRIEHPLPLVSLVGFLRPRLYLASQVCEAFSEAETMAALAHEQGHLVARDNLKRLLLEGCPDWLAFTRLGQRLRDDWAQAAEAAADDGVARAGAGLELASALVKIGRLFPAGPQRPLAASALASGRDLASRVRTLIEAPATAADRRHRALGEMVAWLVLLAIPAVLVALAHSTSALAGIQALAEVLVRLG